MALPGPVCAAAPASRTAQEQAAPMHQHTEPAADCTLPLHQQTGLHEAGSAAGPATPEQQAEVPALSLVRSAADQGDTEDPLSALACAHSIVWAGLAPSSCSPQPIPEGYGNQPDADVADGECVVCWAAAACVIFQPCGHFCTCHACAQPFRDGQGCPMCRETITAAIEL